MISKLLTLFILAVVAAGVASPTRAAAPQAPAAVPTYTGCLTRLNVIIQVAVGDSPANPPCRDGAQIVHFAGGDLTSLTAGAGLTGGGANGDVSIALAPGFRLPQACAANQGTTWNGSAWVCASLTSQAAFDSLVSLLGTPGTINQGSNPVHWTKLKGVPAGLADGIDDAGPAYSAGFGLNLTGTTFSADPAQLQRRVSEDCATGSAIRAVRDDGTVACETVSSGGSGWSLTGNAGTNSTNFIGTTDDQPLNFKVNGQRGLRLEPRLESPNLVGGDGANNTGAGAYGATIAGGGSSTFPNVVDGPFGTVGGGLRNRARDVFDTVAGGTRNLADGGEATVGGGASNVASGRSTVSGGEANKALGFASMIPGGQFNEANGTYSFAAGVGAHADHDGSFVWADTSADSLSSTGPNQFVVRATGGLHLLGGQLFCNGCVTAGDLAPGTTQGLGPYCALAQASPQSYPDAPCRSHLETIDADAVLTSIAIGTDGNPVVSYSGPSNALSLKIARCSDPACATSSRRTIDTPGVLSSIAIGTDGNPVVSYASVGNTLKVARCSDPACTASSLQALNTVAFNTSIAIGTDGNPVISYASVGNTLKVARCSDPACAASTLHTLDTIGFGTSIAIGTDGNPVVSYSGPGNNLKVARCSDPACAASSLETLDTVGSNTSIAIGTDGNPVVSYSGPGNNLKVARCSDPACAASSLETLDTDGSNTSIAIGTDGNPVVSYRGPEETLGVARCSDPACTASSLETLDTVGSDTSIAIGTDGNPVVSYRGPGATLKVGRPAISR